LTKPKKLSFGSGITVQLAKILTCRRFIILISMGEILEQKVKKKREKEVAD